MICKQKRISTIVVFLLIVIGIPSLYWFSEIHFDNVERSRAKTGPPFDSGNKIVVALEKYHTDEGIYPESLDQLIPGYLAEIPPPEWGANQWIYHPYNKKTFDDYMLVARRRHGDYTAHAYSSRSKKWGYDS